MAEGRNAYDELIRKIGEMDAGLAKLRGSYDFAINKNHTQSNGANYI